MHELKDQKHSDVVKRLRAQHLAVLEEVIAKSERAQQGSNAHLVLTLWHAAATAERLCSGPQKVPADALGGEPLRVQDTTMSVVLSDGGKTGKPVPTTKSSKTASTRRLASQENDPFRGNAIGNGPLHQQAILKDAIKETIGKTPASRHQRAPVNSDRPALQNVRPMVVPPVASASRLDSAPGREPVSARSPRTAAWAHGTDNGAASPRLGRQASARAVLVEAVATGPLASGNMPLSSRGGGSRAGDVADSDTKVRQHDVLADEASAGSSLSALAWQQRGLATPPAGSRAPGAGSNSWQPTLKGQPSAAPTRAQAPARTPGPARTPPPSVSRAGGAPPPQTRGSGGVKGGEAAGAASSWPAHGHGQMTPQGPLAPPSPPETSSVSHPSRGSLEAVQALQTAHTRPSQRSSPAPASRGGAQAGGVGAGAGGPPPPNMYRGGSPPGVGGQPGPVGSYVPAGPGGRTQPAYVPPPLQGNSSFAPGLRQPQGAQSAQSHGQGHGSTQPGARLMRVR